ncbi:MAG: DNA starvation/stationary phase protection protein Dps [Planctomycetia bacterium]|nr:DNA starvation/stationary phase protection protein Dps [Planctomycetia bacterium]
MSIRTTNPPTKPEAARRFHTRNNISTENRSKLVPLLNQQLADTIDLYTQLKYAHWNVKGANFIALHKLFDELAEKVERHIDEMAERVTALGGVANGTLRQATTTSRLPEFPLEIVHSHDVVEALAERFATMANTAREAIDQTGNWGDMATADVFTEITRALDEGLYFLEAHLQG